MQGKGRDLPVFLFPPFSILRAGESALAPGTGPSSRPGHPHDYVALSFSPFLPLPLVLLSLRFSPRESTSPSSRDGRVAIRRNHGTGGWRGRGGAGPGTGSINWMRLLQEPEDSEPGGVEWERPDTRCWRFAPLSTTDFRFDLTCADPDWLRAGYFKSADPMRNSSVRGGRGSCRQCAIQHVNRRRIVDLASIGD